MARKHRHAASEAGELNMTAMIDVAFQLLAFFIITLRPVDVFTNLDVSRPKPGGEDNVPLLTITVYKDGPKDGFVLQGNHVAPEELDRQLTRLAEIDKRPSVIIRCTDNSSHRALVRALDICSKAGLKNISVFSL